MLAALATHTLSAETAMLLAQFEALELPLAQGTMRAVFEDHMILVRLPLQSSSTHRKTDHLRDGQTKAAARTNRGLAFRNVSTGAHWKSKWGSVQKQNVCTLQLYWKIEANKIIQIHIIAPPAPSLTSPHLPQY